MFEKKVCVRCYRDHWNVKKNKCNVCLGRVNCKVVGCNKMVDKPYIYCFICNKQFKKYESNISPQGQGCMIVSSDDD